MISYICLSSESDDTKNENEKRSGTGIRKTEIGIRMGTEGTRTGNDPGTQGNGAALGNAPPSPLSVCELTQLHREVHFS